MGCYGDGGAIFTDNDELADKLRSIRVHGKGSDKYDNVRVGQNCRLDTIQAAILIEKLKIYQNELDARQRVADAYMAEIEKLNQTLGEELIVSPKVLEGYKSAWAQYTIRVDERSSLMASLKEKGIPSVVYYRTPSHLLGACAHLGLGESSFPNAEEASKKVMSLPFHPYLEIRYVHGIVSKAKEILQDRTASRS